MTDNTPLKSAQIDPPSYLNREEAAVYLSERLHGNINAQQLGSWRERGPKYYLFRGNKAKRGGGWGRWALYTKADLDAWIEAQLVDPYAEERSLINGHANKLSGPGE